MQSAETPKALDPIRNTAAETLILCQSLPQAALTIENPYVVRFRGDEGEICRESFPDESGAIALVAELERLGIEYLVRTPHWLGGSLTVSSGFGSLWDRLPRAAQVARRPPAREMHGSAKDMRDRPQSIQHCRNSSCTAA